MTVTRKKPVSPGNSPDRRKVVFRLVPVVFLIHNVEQVLTIAQTMEATRTGMPRALRLLVPPVPPADYILALVIATAAAFGFAWWGRPEQGRGPGLYFLASLQVALLLNMAAHAAASVVTGGYTAGLATSIGVVLPFSLVFFWFLLRERWMPLRAFPLLVLAGIVLHLPIFFGVLFLAGKILEVFPGR